MLKSGKKNSRFARQKKKILTLVLFEIFFLIETKNHTPPPPPLQVKWSVPNLMLNSGKKIRALPDKRKYSNSYCPKQNF